MQANLQDKLPLLGWLAFLVSAGFFSIGSAIARDIWSLTASIVFFVACLFFIAPYILGRGKPKG